MLDVLNVNYLEMKEFEDEWEREKRKLSSGRHLRKPVFDDINFRLDDLTGPELLAVQSYIYYLLS